MLIERPPRLFRLCFPGAIFRLDPGKRRVALTFDDGPIPEATPEILDILHRYDVKATFFLVGDNVRKHPELLRRILAEGHAVGSHTMHHIQGLHTSVDEYMADVALADSYVGSNLFRPPHGLMRWGQLRRLRDSHSVVMYDLVTRDYSRHVDANRVVSNVRRLVRPGSIIVFHDSLRSIDKLRTALPRVLDFLAKERYECIKLTL